jgi:hypothetical protein
VKDIIVVSRADLARERQAIAQTGRRVVSEHHLPSGNVMLKCKPVSAGGMIQGSDRGPPRAG